MDNPIESIMEDNTEETIEILHNHLVQVKLESEKKKFALRLELRTLTQQNDTLTRQLQNAMEENEVLRTNLAAEKLKNGPEAVAAPSTKQTAESEGTTDPQEFSDVVSEASSVNWDDPIAVAWEQGNADFVAGRYLDGVRHYTTAASMLANERARTLAKEKKTATDLVKLQQVHDQVVADLEATKADLESQRAAFDAEKHQLEEELSQMQDPSQVQTLETEIEQLKQDLLTASSSTKEQLEAAQREYSTVIEGLERDVEAERSGRAMLEAELNNQGELEEQVQSLKDKIETLEMDLSMERSSTESAAEQARSLQEQLEQAKRDMADAQAQVGGQQGLLEQELAQSQETSQRLEQQLESQRAESTQEIQRLHEELQSVQEQIVDMEERASLQTSEHQEQVQQLESQLNQLQAETRNGADAQEAINNLAAQVDAVNQQLDAANTAKQQAESEVAVLTTDLEAATTQLTKARESNESLMADYREADEEKMQLEDQLEQLATSHAQEIETLKLELNAMASDATAASAGDEQIESLTKKLEESQTAYDDVNMSLAEKTLLYTEMIQTRDELVQQLQEMTPKLRAYEELQEDYDSLLNQQDELAGSGDSSELQRTIDELTTEIQNLNAKNQSLEDRLGAAETSARVGQPPAQQPGEDDTPALELAKLGAKYERLKQMYKKEKKKNQSLAENGNTSPTENGGPDTTPMATGRREEAAVREELDNLQQTLDKERQAREEEVGDLRRNLDQAEELRLTLERKLQDSREQAFETERMLMEAQRLGSSAAEQLQTTQSEMADLQHSKTELQQELSRMETDYEGQVDVRLRLEEQVTQLRAQVQGVQRQVTQEPEPQQPHRAIVQHVDADVSSAPVVDAASLFGAGSADGAELFGGGGEAADVFGNNGPPGAFDDGNQTIDTFGESGGQAVGPIGGTQETVPAPATASTFGWDSVEQPTPAPAHDSRMDDLQREKEELERHLREYEVQIATLNQAASSAETLRSSVARLEVEVADKNTLVHQLNEELVKLRDQDLAEMRNLMNDLKEQKESLTLEVERLTAESHHTLQMPSAGVPTPSLATDLAVDLGAPVVADDLFGGASDPTSGWGETIDFGDELEGEASNVFDAQPPMELPQTSQPPTTQGDQAQLISHLEASVAESNTQLEAAQRELDAVRAALAEKESTVVDLERRLAGAVAPVPEASVESAGAPAEQGVEQLSWDDVAAPSVDDTKEQEHTAKVEAMLEQIKQAEDAKMEAQDGIAQLEAQVLDLKHHVTRLEGQLLVAEERDAADRDALKDAQARHAESEAALRAQHDDVVQNLEARIAALDAELQSKVDNSSQALADANVRVEELERELTVLNGQHAEQVESMNQLVEEAKESTSKVEAREQATLEQLKLNEEELDHLRGNLTIKEERIVEVEQTLSNHSSEKESLTEEISDLKLCMDTMNASLAAKTADLDRVNGDLAVAHENIAGQEALIAEQRERIQSLEATHARMEELQSEVASLIHIQEDLTSRAVHLENVEREKQELVASHGVELDALRQTILEKEKQASELQHKVELLNQREESSKESHAQMTEQITHLNSEVDDLRAHGEQVVQLQNVIDELHQETRVLHEDRALLNPLREQSAKLQTELDKQRALQVELENAINERASDVTQWREKACELENLLEEEKKSSVRTTEYENALQEIKIKESALASLSAKATCLLTCVKELQRERDQARDEAIAAVNYEAGSSLDSSSLRFRRNSDHSVEGALSRRSSIGSDRPDWATKAHDLYADIERFAQVHDETYIKEVEAILAKRTVTDSDYNELKAAHATLQTEYETLRQEHADVATNSDALFADLEQLGAVKRELEQELEQHVHDKSLLTVRVEELTEALEAAASQGPTGVLPAPEQVGGAPIHLEDVGDLCAELRSCVDLVAHAKATRGSFLSELDTDAPVVRVEVPPHGDEATRQFLDLVTEVTSGVKVCVKYVEAVSPKKRRPRADAPPSAQLDDALSVVSDLSDLRSDVEFCTSMLDKVLNQSIENKMKKLLNGATQHQVSDAEQKQAQELLVEVRELRERLAHTEEKLVKTEDQLAMRKSIFGKKSPILPRGSIVEDPLGYPSRVGPPLSPTAASLASSAGGYAGGQSPSYSRKSNDVYDEEEENGIAPWSNDQWNGDDEDEDDGFMTSPPVSPMNQDMDGDTDDEGDGSGKPARINTNWNSDPSTFPVVPQINSIGGQNGGNVVAPLEGGDAGNDLGVVSPGAESTEEDSTLKNPFLAAQRRTSVTARVTGTSPDKPTAQPISPFVMDQKSRSIKSPNTDPFSAGRRHSESVGSAQGSPPPSMYGSPSEVSTSNVLAIPTVGGDVQPSGQVQSSDQFGYGGQAYTETAAGSGYEEYTEGGNQSYAENGPQQYAENGQPLYAENGQQAYAENGIYPDSGQQQPYGETSASWDQSAYTRLEEELRETKEVLAAKEAAFDELTMLKDKLAAENAQLSKDLESEKEDRLWRQRQQVTMEEEIERLNDANEYVEQKLRATAAELEDARSLVTSLNDRVQILKSSPTNSSALAQNGPTDPTAAYDYARLKEANKRLEMELAQLSARMEALPPGDGPAVAASVGDEPLDFQSLMFEFKQLQGTLRERDTDLQELTEEVTKFQYDLLHKEAEAAIAKKEQSSFMWGIHTLVGLFPHLLVLVLAYYASQSIPMDDLVELLFTLTGRDKIPS